MTYMNDYTRNASRCAQMGYTGMDRHLGRVSTVG